MYILSSTTSVPKYSMYLSKTYYIFGTSLNGNTMQIFCCVLKKKQTEALDHAGLGAFFTNRASTLFYCINGNNELITTRKKRGVSEKEAS
jgi:hypothetical protein